MPDRWVISGVGVDVHRLWPCDGCRCSAAGASRPMSSRSSGRRPASWSRGASGCRMRSRRPRLRSPPLVAMSFVAPGFVRPDNIVPVAIGWLVVLTAVNAMGVRAAGGLSVVTVADQGAAAAGGRLDFRPARRDRRGRSSRWRRRRSTCANLAAATALTFFAFTGFECATTPVGKVRDPGRTSAARD